ncbi:hypothetical protein G6F55_014031 [Rhizopus delemar]|nr:hypothetical protein G6F24_017474 [Rhizopus arrhizus]KAG1437882.1 hypothetical protein G6F55_014031 [Rhizopus delemar]
MHFGDIGLGVGDQLGSVRQSTRQVAQVHADAGQAPGAHHAAFDQFAQHQRIDVAARQHQPDALALEAVVARFLRAQQCRQTCGAGAFHHVQSDRPAG